jgi:copper chaperone NosL
MRLPPGIAAAILVLLAGCGGEPAGGPPEIRYGLEECGYCRMIVSEEQHAAAIVDAAGTATPFDDAGCLVDYLRERATAPEQVWVHDHAGGGWIDAEAAWFVRAPRETTPMASGLVAFASRSQADAYAEAHGVAAIPWAVLLETPG